MTREEFKKRWESNEEGGGLTHEDIAECAVTWGLYQKPMIHPMKEVVYNVLREADTSDAEEFRP